MTVAETANKKLVRQLAVVVLIGITLRLGMNRLGWRLPSLDNRLLPAFALWMLFGLYWGTAARNSAPTKSSESWVSTYFHQFMLGAAFLLLILSWPGLTGWFLPQRLHFLTAAGVIVQAGFLGLAVWARLHLGRNWSAEVRIATGHELVRTGPYRWLRHPIYTAMLGMFLGTAIASSQYHALLGLAVLVLAYLRKTRLEDQILAQTFGADYDAYRRHTWALVPLLF
ncbi:MAG TPA: isoprenylcysteine carboxylmethyltransferase family protein [Candidatus Angelobacter sp.]|nr:isoprenylcysteine carboxylmethyltransferase family protein [Candidatus Angelobacter sp.]